MPYAKNDDLPDNIKKALPTEAQSIFRNAFNAAFDKQKDEESSVKMAWGAVKNAGWIKKENEWVKDNTDKTYNIDNKEIFAVGTWDGTTVTEKDLQEIENNFYILKDKLKPPLKLGHRDNLNDRTKDGEPALGWITSVKKVGTRLKASFSKVPEIVYRAIIGGGYRTVSSEVFKNYTNNGKSYGKALAGVALVGADLPAVTNLQDLANYYTEQNIDIITYTNGGVEVTIEELQAQYKKDLEVERSAKEQAVLRVQKLEETCQKLENEKSLNVYTQKVDTFKVFCEDNVKAGKMTPASRDKMLNIIDKKEYTEGNTEIYFSIDDVKEIIENSATILPQGQTGSGSGNKPKPGYIDPGAEVSKLVKNHMDEFKLDYDKALIEVLNNNPELADDYINDVVVNGEAE